jgi:hypothetical protein
MREIFSYRELSLEFSQRLPGEFSANASSKYSYFIYSFIPFNS